VKATLRMIVPGKHAWSEKIDLTMTMTDERAARRTYEYLTEREIGAELTTTKQVVEKNGL